MIIPLLLFYSTSIQRQAPLTAFEIREQLIRIAQPDKATLELINFRGIINED